jgi:hypothetical protein
MEERVALVGGGLMIRLLNPRGVRVVASIPLGSRVIPTPVKDVDSQTPLIVA